MLDDSRAKINKIIDTQKKGQNAVRSEIDGIDKLINEQNELAKEAAKKLDGSILGEIQKEITQDVIKRLNKVLMDCVPNQNLVKFLETFAALLRNVRVGSNIDVEMYFSDYKKLQVKLAKVCDKKKTFDFELVQMHLQTLASLTKTFKDQSNPDFGINHHYVSLLCWAQTFCIETTKELKVKEHTDKALELQSRKEALIDQLPSIDKIITMQTDLIGTKELGHDFFEVQTREAQDRKKQYEQFIERDKVQAEYFQRLYNGFAESYENKFKEIAEHVLEREE